MIQKAKQQPITVYPFLACQDLASLERPRYFTGQLLTADELNSEQSYIAAKQSLHHRYLHGPRGRIIIGLQVTISKDAGFLDIAPGYAIDYCGNDIVVPAVAAFDVLAQVRANASVPNSSTVWNPAAQIAESKPMRQQYWLTLAYDEQEVRPTNALNQSLATVARRKDCGCGNQQNASTAQRATTVIAQGNANPAPTTCEPTRIREWYRCDILAASDANTSLSNARLTEDNRLVLARITLQNGEVVQVENEVAARQVWPVMPFVPTPIITASELKALQDAVTVLQDALRALQDEIAQLKETPPMLAAVPTPPTPLVVGGQDHNPLMHESGAVSEMVQPPPSEAPPTTNQGTPPQ